MPAAATSSSLVETVRRFLEEQQWQLEDGRWMTTASVFAALARREVSPHSACREPTAQSWSRVGQRFQLIGRYGVLKRIGRGSFGEVYLGVDAQRSNRLVAIKKPTDSFLEHLAQQAGIAVPQSGSDDAPGGSLEQVRQMIGQVFSHEALLTARLSMCPYVVAVLDHNVAAPYIVLEYCDGGSLLGRLRAPYTVADVVRWGHAIASALAAAHSMRPDCLIHRDLKTENVLFAGGEPKVADFGTSQMAEESQSLRSLQGGFTPAYAAPEAFDGRAYPQTDVWSLGVILYEMLAGGRRPFDGTMSQMMASITKGRFERLAPATPAEQRIIDLVHRCLEHEVAARPSAHEVAAALSGLALPPEVAARPVRAAGAGGALPAGTPRPASAPVQPMTPMSSAGTLQATAAGGAPARTLYGKIPRKVGRALERALSEFRGLAPDAQEAWATAIGAAFAAMIRANDLASLPALDQKLLTQLRQVAGNTTDDRGISILAWLMGEVTRASDFTAVVKTASARAGPPPASAAPATPLPGAPVHPIYPDAPQAAPTPMPTPPAPGVTAGGFTLPVAGARSEPMATPFPGLGVPAPSAPAGLPTPPPPAPTGATFMEITARGPIPGGPAPIDLDAPAPSGSARFLAASGELAEPADLEVPDELLEPGGDLMSSEGDVAIAAAPAPPPVEPDAPPGKKTSRLASLLSKPIVVAGHENAAAQREAKDSIQKGAAAVYEYERTGDLSHLGEASKHYEAALATLESPQEKAAAQSGLANVLLLRGDRRRAADLAKEALRLDPVCFFAVDVIVRMLRDEAARSSMRTGFLAIAREVEKDRWSGAFDVAARLIDVFGDEPGPRLVAYWTSHQQAHEDEARKHLVEAIARYPSKRFGDVVFGGTLDADIATALVERALRPLVRGDAEAFDRVLEPERPSNTTGGALRLAVGLVNVALADATIVPAEQKRLQTVLAAALMLLRHTDFARQQIVGAAEREVETAAPAQAAAQRLFETTARIAQRADGLGVPTKPKAPACPGLSGLNAYLKKQLKVVILDLETRKKELGKTAGAYAGRIVMDDDARAEVAGASKVIGGQSLLWKVDDALASLGQIKAERRSALMKALVTQGNLDDDKFAKHAASVLQQATGLVREARFKVTVAMLRREWRKGIVELGQGLLQDRYIDHVWKNETLKEYARTAKATRTFMEYHREEYQRLEYRITRLHGLR